MGRNAPCRCPTLPDTITPQRGRLSTIAHIALIKRSIATDPRRATLSITLRANFLKIHVTSQTHAALRRHLYPIEQEDKHEEKPMTKTPRWMQSTIADAKSCSTKMPWERGLRREAFIASRRAVAALAEMDMRTHRPAA